MAQFLLVAVTMMAFAANSVLNRVGVATFGMDPMDFALIRTASGAVVLSALVKMRGGTPFAGLLSHWRGAAALAVYMIGFSWAYLSLGAGLGALILFGVLQIVMFGWAVIAGQAVPVTRWIGAGVALIGLAVLLWPAGAERVPTAGALAMAGAGAAWGVYTILGQGAKDPLVATAGNFCLCLPLVALAVLGGLGTITISGVLTACVAGAVTSGLGYALWYRVLPGLATTVAAVAQLSVPVIAVVAGVVLLGEPVGLRLVIAGALVLGGIALSLKRRASAESAPTRHR